jgi:hypothetical protein
MPPRSLLCGVLAARIPLPRRRKGRARADARREACRALAFGQGPDQAITVDATNVYWASNGSVLSLPVNGGTPTTLAAGQVGVNGIVVDATSAYWTTDGAVMKVTPK